MEHDHLGARGLRDAGRVVEHPDGHVQLLAALRVTHERGQRRVDREDDPGLPGELAEPPGEVVVHPEPAREVDLAGVVAPLLQALERALRGLPGGNPCWAETDDGHSPHGSPSDALSTLRFVMRETKQPTRIDLLELDIDLRLADLWREAAEIGEWNLEVVAAFMRAAYGKGYCDALTEDAPGSLCVDHGYRVPARRSSPSRTSAALRAAGRSRAPRCPAGPWARIAAGGVREHGAAQPLLGPSDHPAGEVGRLVGLRARAASPGGSAPAFPHSSAARPAPSRWPRSSAAASAPFGLRGDRSACVRRGLRARRAADRDD